MARRPRPLRKGDTIAIVSPSSPMESAKAERTFTLLEAEGYRVRPMPHCWDRHVHLAGTDADRASDLMTAFLDPEVQAVLCARGGYGAARLLPHLDLDAMAAEGKLFAGFSDVTTLHLALNRRGLATLHAPMPLTLSVPREPWVMESFLRALRGEDPVPEEAPVGSCLVAGVAEGVVTGGCLCLLTDSLGTPETLDCRDRIVLIEDVDEAPHRIDAMLTHLLNSGQAATAAGFVVGEMTRTDERAEAGIGGPPWREIVADRLGHLGVPVIVGYPMGHAANMLSLPLGIRARMDADLGTLTYLEPLCVAT